MMNRIRQETHRQRTRREMAGITIGMVSLIGLITACVWAVMP